MGEVHEDLRCPRCDSNDVVCHGKKRGHKCLCCGYDGTTTPPAYLRSNVRRSIAEQLRSEAEIAARPGQYDRLMAIADQIWPEGTDDER